MELKLSQEHASALAIVVRFRRIFVLCRSTIFGIAVCTLVGLHRLDNFAIPAVARAQNSSLQAW